MDHTEEWQQRYMSNPDVRDRFAQFLNDRFIELMQEKGRAVSLITFADYISKRAGMRISNASLSFWMNRARLPEGDNIHALATAFGIFVYELLGQQVFIPTSGIAKAITDDWPEMTPEEREEVMRVVERSRQRRQAKGMSGSESAA